MERKRKLVPVVSTQIRANKEDGSHSVYLTYNKKDYRRHKSNLTLDEAIKESVSVKGHFRLLRDIINSEE